ncbi:hypothetical protein TWF281_005799 [Arthrobotrys megalospora]
MARRSTIVYSYIYVRPQYPYTGLLSSNGSFTTPTSHQQAENNNVSAAAPSPGPPILGVQAPSVQGNPDTGLENNTSLAPDQTVMQSPTGPTQSRSSDLLHIGSWVGNVRDA